MRRLGDYLLYVECGKRCWLEGIFHNETQIVFEGMSRDECMKWAHSICCKMMNKVDYLQKHNASFRKVNAKKKFNPDDYRVAHL